MVGITVIPVSYYLIILTAHGPGSHAAAGLGLILLLYPISTFILMTFQRSFSDAFLSQIVTAVALLVAIIQFPAYGFIISSVRLGKSLWLKLASIIVWLHISVIAVVLGIAFIREFL